MDIEQDRCVVHCYLPRFNLRTKMAATSATPLDEERLAHEYASEWEITSGVFPMARAVDCPDVCLRARRQNNTFSHTSYLLNANCPRHGFFRFVRYAQI